MKLSIWITEITPKDCLRLQLKHSSAQSAYNYLWENVAFFLTSVKMVTAFVEIANLKFNVQAKLKILMAAPIQDAQFVEDSGFSPEITGPNKF
jgi:hypothetical protein